ncbi:MAG TPA: WecB/TagA/CpsF family glycosyltransferase [Candidatus Angelobacter sp.]|nr:WecB/TagA/CpsF family glycosyltransferase [Candidatus Angelobacter sp.]
MIEPALERPRYANPPIAILGVPFDNVTTSETIDAIQRMVESGKPHYLVTANVDFLVQAQEDVELRRILFDAHLVLCDGTPLLWASQLLGNPLLERVAGADLVPLLLRVAAEKGYRVFFLGATPESCAQAVENLKKKHPALIIADYYSPPFNKLLEMDHEEIKARILAAKPDLLFVSLGCPKQEKWIAMHYRSLGVPVSAGVGATIDFLAGTVKRAPVWMQRIGTEWIYRLAQEPRRLFKRYFKDLWVFGWKLLIQLWQLQLRSRKRTRTSFVAHPNGARSIAPRNGSGATSGAMLRAPIRGEQAKIFSPEPDRASSRRLLQDDWQWLSLPDRLDLAAVRHDGLLADHILIDGRHCLLEMDKVRFIDSTGMGLLIRLQKKIHAGGGEMVLLAPSAAVRRALALMQLQNFFAIAPDLAAARELLAARAREQSSAVKLRGTTSQDALLWHGEITAANAQEVWNTTEPHLTSNPQRDLVIDLSGLRFIDSTGLGLMVRAKKLAQRERVKLEFVRPQPAVQNVIHLARLEELLVGKKETAVHA